ncbi:unnamed protein product [Lupinus luteus]|uniref:Pectinesterase inhibitor domain-containing protein n=1 Tax=Lupinus luteus TaxID=3873 RepID=A0AAV1XMS5_LUPLU
MVRRIQFEDSSFCSNILNSKPGGTKGADLVSLVRYASEVARSNVANTIKLTNMLIEKNGTDPKVKAKYNSCLSNFHEQFGCLGHIDSVQKNLKKGNYYLVNYAALGIISNVNRCLARDHIEEPPFPDTTNLHTFVDIIKKVASIIDVISKILMEK